MEVERAREGPLACLISLRAHATENAKQLQREEKASRVATVKAEMSGDS
jgi:hypothetical protein